MKLVISEKAQLDYDESLEWYAERNINSGVKFIVAIDEAYKRIASNPLSWRVTEADFREITLRAIPFAIVYKILEQAEEILVTAIYHYKRDPAYKYNRNK